MTTNRFTYQQQCVRNAHGLTLNVGCKEDPAQLKAFDPNNVVNLDRHDYNEDLLIHEGRRVPIQVDVVHDILEFPWPFADDTFRLVLFGDMLEDLPDDGCQVRVLREAHRIGRTLAITTPEDTVERDAHHLTTITETRLKGWLAQTGWEITDFQVVNYGFVPRGYFVSARRAGSSFPVV